MATPESSTKEKVSEEDYQDLISELPAHVTDRILKHLPILMAAKMSVLSKTWRRNWFSLRYLVFDAKFWEDQSRDGSLSRGKFSSIISNTLLYNNAHVYKFHLCIPENIDFNGRTPDLNPWLSFLSRNGVKKVTLDNWVCYLNTPHHIFLCKELVKLRLEFFTLNPPPSDFKGFENLLRLDLVHIRFQDGSFSSLIAKCPRLKMLWLVDWTGLNHIVIDAPNLEKVFIQGAFASLSVKNAPSLFHMSVYLEEATEEKPSKPQLIDAMKFLASSSELEYLRLGQRLFEFLAAGELTKSLPLAFNRLVQLSLTRVPLGDLDVFHCTLGIIRSCPYIEDFQLSVIASTNSVQHELEFDPNYKLGRLIAVTIEGITGSSAELKLIEYLLAMSIVLEKMVLECAMLDSKSELKMSRELMRLPRASPKAQLIYLEPYI